MYGPGYSHSVSCGFRDEQAAQAVGIQFQRIPQKRKLEDEYSPMRAAPTQLRPDHKMCAKCADLDIDFRGALQKAARIRLRNDDIFGTELWNGIYVANVGHQYRKAQLTDCALCRILFASRIRLTQHKNKHHASRDVSVASGHLSHHSTPKPPALPPYSPPVDDGDEIRLFGFLDNSGLVRSTTSFLQYDSALLAVVPRHFGSNKGCQGGKSDLLTLKDHVQEHGSAVLLQDGDHPMMFSAQAVPAVFDIEKASHWLEYCKSNHSTLCGGLAKSLVSGLRLIDCHTLSITEAENSRPYVALSYVWAEKGEFDTEIRCIDKRLLLPVRLSPAIFDAIRVTTALGFRYLWVDKFCIDQDNKDTKHQQIKQMNAIYENADLTIVAAAGPDETYGLPGVSQRPRKRQQIARFNGLSVISTMRHPHISIQSSRWASRGWTYQEAALSRRRLVFTDEQLYFECDTMNCFESVYSPLDRLHPGAGAESLENLRTGMFGIGTTTSIKFGSHGLDRSFFTVFQQYLSAVQDYTARDLTYDSDSLNAFQGIIQRYSTLREPITSTWGMPSHPNDNSYFCWALTWSHTERCFRSARPPKRRQDFPSWTWAGWAGAVQARHRSAVLQDRIWDGRGIQAVQFGHRDVGYLEPECNFRVLYLWAKTLPFSLFKENWRREWTFHDHKAELFPTVDVEGLKLSESRIWRCIWIGTADWESFGLLIRFILPACTWERVGLFRIACFAWEMEPLMEDVAPRWFPIM